MGVGSLQGPNGVFKELRPKRLGSECEDGEDSRRKPRLPEYNDLAQRSTLKTTRNFKSFLHNSPGRSAGSNWTNRMKVRLLLMHTHLYHPRKGGSLNMNITTTKVKEVKECRNSPVDISITWKLVRKVSM